MKAKLYIICRCVGSLSPAPGCSLEGGSVSVSPHRPRLVDSRSSRGVLNHSGLLSSIPNSTTRLPGLCLMFGVGLRICFHLLLGEDSHKTVMLSSCLQA